MAKPTNALSQINRSGFPFQLRVEDDITTTAPIHGWRVASREHPWALEDGSASIFASRSALAARFGWRNSLYDQLPQLPPGEFCVMLVTTCFVVTAQSCTQPLFCSAAVSS